MPVVTVTRLSKKFGFESTFKSNMVSVKAKFHYAVQLASRSATSSRAGRKLDSVMEFGRELICDLLASKIAHWNMA